MPLSEGAEIELTLKMPSEITLGESMRVRCRGRVLRILNAADNGWKPVSVTESKPADASPVETKSGETNPAQMTKSGDVRNGEKETDTKIKIGVAVCLKGYEYLPETEDTSSDFRRISALHSTSEPDRANSIPASPRVAAQ
jgi:hypothetical protein